MTDTVAMVDAITGNAEKIPAAANVAYYITGNGIRWTPAQIARIRGARVPILQQFTTDRDLWRQAAVLDIEPHALTIPEAAIIARWRHDQHLTTTAYSDASDAPAVWRTLGSIPGLTQWVANYSLTEAEARALIHGHVVAIQYASPAPGANSGERLPCSRLTIVQAHVDLSVASVDWLKNFRAAQSHAETARKTTARKTLQTLQHVRRPHPKTAGGTLGAALLAAATAYARTHGLHLDGAESTLITAAGALIAAAAAPNRKAER